MRGKGRDAGSAFGAGRAIAVAVAILIDALVLAFTHAGDKVAGNGTGRGTHGSTGKRTGRKPPDSRAGRGANRRPLHLIFGFTARKSEHGQGGNGKNSGFHLDFLLQWIRPYGNKFMRFLFR